MNSTNHTLQAIIWDMDGVLVDNSELHFQTWIEIYRRFETDGQPLRRAVFDEVFGMRNAEAIPRFFGSDRATPAFIKEVTETKEELFRQRIQGQIRPLPGVQTWLNYWQAAGVKQALGSSAPWANIEAILNELGAYPFFQAIVSGESPEVRHSKPAPDVFLEAARQLEVSPAHCLVVEDALVGVQAARAAGMRCLAVTTTHSRADLAAANLVLDNLADLPPDRLLAQWPKLG